MRDRYSIAVGLIFAAVVVIAILHQAGQGKRDARPRPPAPALAVAGVRGSARDQLAGRGRQRRPGRLLQLEPAVPGTPHPRLPGRRTGSISGLRPLRPALGDLVLVHERGRLRRTAGRRQPRLRALPWAGGISVAGRARRSRNGARTGARTRLADAGRLRPRRSGRRPSTGSAAVRPSPTRSPAGPCRAPPSATSTRPSCPPASRTCCARPGPPKVAAGAEMAGSSAPSDRRRRLAARGPEQGWVAPHVAAEFPGLGIVSISLDGLPGEEPRGRAAAASATSPTASTARTRSTCANGRSPGPTGSSSGRSALTPTAPAPRSSSSPWNASTTAPSRARACPRTR